MAVLSFFARLDLAMSKTKHAAFLSIFVFVYFFICIFVFYLNILFNSFWLCRNVLLSFDDKESTEYRKKRLSKAHISPLIKLSTIDIENLFANVENETCCFPVMGLKGISRKRLSKANHHL